MRMSKMTCFESFMKTSSNHLSSSLTVEVWLVVFYLKFYITRQKLFCCDLRRRFTLSLSHFSCSVVSLPSLALHAQLNHSEGNTDVSLLVKVLDIRKLKYQVRRERRTKWTKGRRESEPGEGEKVRRWSEGVIQGWKGKMKGWGKARAKRASWEKFQTISDFLQS